MTADHGQPAADTGYLSPRQLARLRTLRGYTEDEAELAAMAADEIERLRGQRDAERGYITALRNALRDAIAFIDPNVAGDYELWQRLLQREGRPKAPPQTPDAERG